MTHTSYRIGVEQSAALEAAGDPPAPAPADRARAALEALEARKHWHDAEGEELWHYTISEHWPTIRAALEAMSIGDIVRETPKNSRGVAPARTGQENNGRSPSFDIAGPASQGSDGDLPAPTQTAEPAADYDWMPEARQAAAQCWCDEETSGIEMDPRLAEAVARRIAAWMQTGAFHCRNEAYWHDRAKAAESAAPPAGQEQQGWVLVPKEPTDEMLEVLRQNISIFGYPPTLGEAADAYRELLAAAQPATQQQTGEG